jgi:hypothetical protein
MIMQLVGVAIKKIIDTGGLTGISKNLFKGV